MPKCETPYHKCETWSQWNGLQADITQTIKLPEENTFSLSLGGHKITKEKPDKVDFMKIKTSAHQKMPVRKWINHNLQKKKKITAHTSIKEHVSRFHRITTIKRQFSSKMGNTWKVFH